jgi:hypothetical protein
MHSSRQWRLEVCPMTDHEGFAGNETLMHALFADVESRPDEEAVSPQVPGAKRKKSLRARKVSDRSLGLRTAERKAQDEAFEQLATDFIAKIIQEYERILERGLPPSRAIASVVGWASSECQRIRS